MTTIDVFEVAGTLGGYQSSASQRVSDPTADWLGTGLAGNANFNHIPVDYPAAVYPMGPSINTGVKNLTAAINSAANPFILVGTSQGACVIADVYDQLRSGNLTSHRSNLLAGITFGNPRRQAGHSFTGGTDPGGVGADKKPLADTEDLWWDFAVPGDPISTVGVHPFTGAKAYWMHQCWEALLGNIPLLNGNILALAPTVFDAATSMGPTEPHGEWGVWDPINMGRCSATGGKSCYQLALAYILTI